MFCLPLLDVAENIFIWKGSPLVARIAPAHPRLGCCTTNFTQNVKLILGKLHELFMAREILSFHIFLYEHIVVRQSPTAF